MPEVPYDELVQKYGKATADNVLRMLDEGVSPSVIRELDPWTGAKHWEYKMPQPTGNVNIWQVPVGPDGVAQPDKAVWVGPAPAPGPPPTHEDLMKPATAKEPVTIVQAPAKAAEPTKTMTKASEPAPPTKEPEPGPPPPTKEPEPGPAPPPPPPDLKRYLPVAIALGGAALLLRLLK